MEQIETTRTEAARVELQESVCEHAESLRAAMDRIKIDTLETPVGAIRAGWRRSNVGSASYLAWLDDCDQWGEPLEGGDLTSDRLGDGSEGFYVHGDFNAWLRYPTVEEALRYSENVNAIVEAFNEAAAAMATRCNAAAATLEGAAPIEHS